MSDEQAYDAQGNEEEVRKRREQQRQVELQKMQLLRRYLTPEAMERMVNVLRAHPDVYDKFVNILIAMVQGNNIMSKMTDAQVKEILAKLSSRPKPNIEFRHK